MCECRRASGETTPSGHGTAAFPRPSRAENSGLCATPISNRTFATPYVSRPFLSHARSDYYTQGPRSFFRLHEKGGRYNVVPAHHTAQAYVDAYLTAAGIGQDRRGPLFRSCEPGRRDALQARAMSRLSALKMIKRRARTAGLPVEICAHSFRGTGITEYLRNGGDLEVAARIAGLESTRTTQLYNRLPEEISLDEIERIHI